MKKFNVFETFSGIGSQNLALSNLKSRGIIDFEILGTSDWDIYASSSYSAIHKFEKKISLNKNELKIFFKKNILSLDGKNPYNNFYKKFSSDELEKIYFSFKKANNIGTIVNSYERVKKYIIEKNNKKIDLLTYSFPCQDLSSAGNFHGFNEGIKKHTRSGLLFEIEKLLLNLKNKKLVNGKVIDLTVDEKKIIKKFELKNKKLIDNNFYYPNNLLPKYLLLENVINLTYKNHKEDFNKWLLKLNKMGYKTIWGIVDSSDFGLIQKRRRVFALSIFDPNQKLNWFLRNDLNDELLKIKKNHFFPKNTKNHKLIFDFEDKYYDENKICQIKKTNSRLKIIKLGKNISPGYNNNIGTVTTKQDRWPNLGTIYRKTKRKDFTNRRFVSPRETYKLMGFNDIDFLKSKKVMEFLCVSKINAREKLYRQAGNSIAVNSLEMIFYFMQKIDKDIE